MSWGEPLSKELRSQKDSDDELVDRDQDQQMYLYLPPERRNDRYVGSYRIPPAKRYPVAKRSPKSTQNKLKTDPKVPITRQLHK